ncbi:MAG: alpha/beta hydrolase family protein [Gemmataceae bacterium]
MRTMSHAPFVSLAALFTLLFSSTGLLSAADDIESKRVNFPTVDEVELSGTFYRSAPAGKKDKDAVVLLLHDFRHNKGGGSQEDGWRQLAGELQKEGYSVLSFDFRGFGNSKSVSPKFWMHPHNKAGIRAAKGRTPPASIDQKDFSARYYINLVNDIAAARAYLNVLNDSGDVNSSNILVVGAGQGATLGALWLASECRRQRDPRSDRLPEGQLPQWGPLTRFDQPEGNDLGAAVWMTISPELETMRVGGSVKNALVDAAQKARIPTYFLYGKTDDKAANLVKNNMDAILMENGKKIESKNVKEKAIPGTDLAGSKLLGVRKTADYIIDYLNRVVEDRGSRVRKAREDQKYAFCWSLPWPAARGVDHIPAKLPGEPLPYMIPLKVFGVR